MTFLKHMLQDKKIGTQPQFHKKEKKNWDYAIAFPCTLPKMN